MRFLRHCLLGLTLLTGLSGAGVRIVGSDLLGPGFTDALQEYADRNEWDATVGFAGSYPAWEDLQAGRADIALLSFSPAQTLPADPFYFVPIAYHTVKVLVAANSPLRQVDFLQLADVFGGQESTGWKRWSDLGVVGEASTRSVVPYALVRPPGMLLELFAHAVVNSKPLNPGLKLLSSDEELSRVLQASDGGIALAAQSPADANGVKLVAVAREPGGVAFPPDAEAVHRGDYPLSWPVYLVFRRDQVKRLYPVLRYLLGQEVATSLQKAQLTPVPAAVRAELLYGLETL
jgi:hypothetical protein